MHISSGVAFSLATSSLAALHPDCYAKHASTIAEYSECAPPATVAQCLSRLQDFELADVRACYIAAGCRDDEAAREAEYSLHRCNDLDDSTELRKRYGVTVLERAAETTAPAPKLSGDQCFTTTQSSTTDCPLTTSNGKTKPGPCTTKPIDVASCAPGLLCTKDKNGDDVCMQKHDKLDTSGVVVAIVFAACIALGLGALFFMCCKERREQKRLAIKAEATALARAHTKKQRSQEARAPLMQQQDVGPDPFHG